MSDRRVEIGSISLRLRGVPVHASWQVAGRVGETVAQAVAAHVLRGQVAASDLASLDLGRIAVQRLASTDAIASAVGRALVARHERGGR